MVIHYFIVFLFLHFLLQTFQFIIIIGMLDNKILWIVVIMIVF